MCSDFKFAPQRCYEYRASPGRSRALVPWRLPACASRFPHFRPGSARGRGVLMAVLWFSNTRAHERARAPWGRARGVVASCAIVAVPHALV